MSLNKKCILGFDKLDSFIFWPEYKANPKISFILWSISPLTFINNWFEELIEIIVIKLSKLAFYTSFLCIERSPSVSKTKTF